MKSSLFLVVVVACSGHSASRVDVPDDIGIAGAQSEAPNDTSEVGGAPNYHQSKPPTGGAEQTGGALSATGGSSVGTSSLPTTATGGTTQTYLHATGGASSPVATSSLGAAGVAPLLANQCVSRYPACSYEPTCDGFASAKKGTCTVYSFVCGKYSGWVIDNGPAFVAQVGSVAATKVFGYYSDYLAANCSQGGSSGAGGAASSGGAAPGGSATGGASTSAPPAADCSVKTSQQQCVYANAANDPSKCVGRADPNIVLCKTALNNYCGNETDAALRCLYACRGCAKANDARCNELMHDVPGDINQCILIWD